MLVESDQDYVIRRAEEERAAGVVAANVEARQAHIELAWRCCRHLRLSSPPKLPISLIDRLQQL